MHKSLLVTNEIVPFPVAAGQCHPQRLWDANWRDVLESFVSKRRTTPPSALNVCSARSSANSTCHWSRWDARAHRTAQTSLYPIIARSSSNQSKHLLTVFRDLLTFKSSSPNFNTFPDPIPIPIPIQSDLLCSSTTRVAFKIPLRKNTICRQPSLCLIKRRIQHNTDHISSRNIVFLI